MLADRIDVCPLVLRLGRDALPARRRRDDLAQFRRCRDRRVLGVADEPLESRLTERLIASGESPHRADEVADTRDRGRLAADAQLRASRNDLRAVLTLELLALRPVVQRAD